MDGHHFHIIIICFWEHYSQLKNDCNETSANLSFFQFLFVFQIDLSNRKISISSNRDGIFLSTERDGFDIRPVSSMLFASITKKLNNVPPKRQVYIKTTFLVRF